ncbi:MAG TPA: M20/M25/M40 family metallo-hydrolase [Polyangiaceae bacterium]|nr:M20/M25/M40 family metallo-hydrolase [Polyangiaceae bacterium]
MVEPASFPHAARIDWDAAAAEGALHLKQLLRIDTTNPPGNERAAADYIARVLGGAGIPFRVVEAAPTRASLVARLPGSGKGAPLLLSGHLDVVPAEPERWRHDPFGGEEHDGCIWGRGAIDMKNMVAMSLVTLLLLHRTGARLDRDVVFAAVADEEAGSRMGAGFLVDRHPELVRAEYVLTEIGAYTLYFGDAVFYPIQVAEKGICWFELTAEGTAGHGSMPRDDSAVVRIARAVEALGTVRLPLHKTPVVEAFLRRLAQGAPFPQNAALPLLLNPRLAGALLELVRRQDPEQAVGLNALLRNTASPTVLKGGTKVNVIPSTASVIVDGRILPGETVGDFLREIENVVGPDLKVTVHEQREGTVFDPKTPLFDAIRRTIEAHHPGAVTVPFMIPGFTDAHAYAQLGATCYGFTPVRMPRGMSYTSLYHGHDERIPVDGFAWGLRVLYDLVSSFCGGG